MITYDPQLLPSLRYLEHRLLLNGLVLAVEVLSEGRALLGTGSLVRDSAGTCIAYSNSTTFDSPTQAVDAWFALRQQGDLL